MCTYICCAYKWSKHGNKFCLVCNSMSSALLGRWLDTIKRLNISFFLLWPLCHRGTTPKSFSFSEAVHSVSLSSLISFCQPFVSFRTDSRRFPYLSTLVSARRLFMMPRAPTPPENPFWRELELDWRGCPMAISESCFCMIARFTCRQRRR